MTLTKQQKDLLVKRKEELKFQLGDRKWWGWVGIMLIAISIFSGLSEYGGFIPISILLIAGFILAIWGFSSRSSLEKELNEIEFKLAGTKEYKEIEKFESEGEGVWNKIGKWIMIIGGGFIIVFILLIAVLVLIASLGWIAS